MNQNSRTWAARLGVGAAAAVALAAATVPAHADPSAPPSADATMDQAVKIGGPGSHGKAVPVWISANRVTNLKVTFDLSQLTAVATATFPKNCTAAGSTETCTFGAAGDDFYQVMPVVLAPAKGAKTGDHGTISSRASADGIAGTTYTSTVTLIDGVDMVMLSGSDQPDKAKPKQRIGLPVTFTNAGNRAVDGFQITLDLDHGLLPDTYSNCRYGDDHRSHVVVCTFTDPADAVPPGWAVQLDDFGVTVAGDALGLQATEMRVDGLDTGDAVAPAVKLSKRTGGKALHVKKVATAKAAKPVPDIDDNDNWGLAMWDVANGKDVAALGATASGKVGDVVPVTIGVKNNGPGTLDGSRADEPVLWFIFQIPPGTEVASAPRACGSIVEDGNGQVGHDGAPAGTYYRCATGNFLAAGDTFPAAFQLKITSVIPNATGTVGFYDKYASPPDWMHDDVPANDKASVVINPSTGGTGGGSGSLPITGARTGLLAGTGVLLLVAGGAMYLIGRRRKATTFTQ